MLEKVSEVGRMRFEIIGSLTCDANFILAAELQASGLLRDLGQEP
jgi:hypothetical protein